MSKIVRVCTKDKFISSHDFSYPENPDEFILWMEQIQFIQQWLEEKSTRIPRLTGESLVFSQEIIDSEENFKRCLLNHIANHKTPRKDTLLVRTSISMTKLETMKKNTPIELKMLEKYPAYKKIIFIKVSF